MARGTSTPRSSWLAALWLVLVPPSVAAQEVPISVDAPAGCVDGATLALLVEERIGGPVRRGDAAVVTITKKKRAGYAASVAFAGEEALKARLVEVPVDDCHALDSGLVVVIATAFGLLDPGDGVVARLAYPPVEPSAPPPASEPTRAPPVAARAPRRRLFVPTSAEGERSPPVRYLGAAALASTGLLPRVAGGGELHVGFERDGHRVLLGVRGTASGRHAFGQGASVRGTAVVARLAYCGEVMRWDGAALAVALCPGVRGGAMEARTSGLARDMRRWSEVVEAELALRVHGRLRPATRLYGAVSAGFPLWAPALSVRGYEGETERYHSPSPGVTAEVGLEFDGLL